jgi:membrane protein YqaA with SNARE-associated domain
LQQNPAKIPRWLQHAVATFGGFGLFLVAFLDSSILSFPVITDLLVIDMTVRNPVRMAFYAAMATAGSLAGCIWLYLLARKGGEAYFHRNAGHRAENIRRWVGDHAFWSVFIPAVLPPPLPFKLFVIGEGVFQVPLRIFVLALIAGRGFRYFGEGFLAIRYGRQVLSVVMAHRILFLAATATTCGMLLILGALLKRKRPSGA